MNFCLNHFLVESAFAHSYVSITQLRASEFGWERWSGRGQDRVLRLGEAIIAAEGPECAGEMRAKGLWQSGEVCTDYAGTSRASGARVGERFTCSCGLALLSRQKEQDLPAAQKTCWEGDTCAPLASSSDPGRDKSGLHPHFSFHSRMHTHVLP